MRLAGKVALVTGAQQGIGAAIAVAASGERRNIAIGGGLGAALITLAWMFPPEWNPMLMTSGVYKYVDNLD